MAQRARGIRKQSPIQRHKDIDVPCPLPLAPDFVKAALYNTVEEQLRYSEKMDSIGTLAGGVAHDFNNILTVIINACTLLKIDAAADSEILSLVNQIDESAEKAAGLTHSLLAFSREQGICKQPEDISFVVRNMQGFLARVIGENIRLTLKFIEPPLMVMLDQPMIEQVLINLANNARDAMPKGGSLDISVVFFKNDGTLTGLEIGRRGDYALLTVADTGEGISGTAQQRIFEPFFTTKGLGNGAGLGLSIVYGIIRQHDGVINVHSEPGIGTTFRIYLPLCA